MNEENTLLMTKENSREEIPIRCSIYGKLIAILYPEAIPGVLYATCRSGHKIQFRKDKIQQRNAG